MASPLSSTAAVVQEMQRNEEKDQGLGASYYRDLKERLILQALLRFDKKDRDGIRKEIGEACPATVFWMFPGLPNELQCRVWGFVCQEPRIIDIGGESFGFSLICRITRPKS